ncbi:hypothetical protein [Candidatus Neptunochlamydia vexilliferae]|uniref:Uncharacterized protein n=1 Tax=Candidatus Neptunichlamydia vexilliferae TaxID=1651774 RepID=A0ABS0B0Z1_9BACT|nr:hypothetical protein [Candidatus Neptunochlamydia vexilliferae]MBF5059865.1 hypothetical protein [Candidatus Neptunochlamydia vexilliferae]
MFSFDCNFFDNLNRSAKPSPIAGQLVFKLFQNSAPKPSSQDILTKTALYGLGALATSKYTHMGFGYAGAYGLIRGITDTFFGNMALQLATKAKVHPSTDSAFHKKACAVIVERAVYATIMFLFLKAVEVCAKKHFKKLDFKGIKPLDALKIEGVFFALTALQVATSYSGAATEFLSN